MELWVKILTQERVQMLHTGALMGIVQELSLSLLAPAMHYGSHFQVNTIALWLQVLFYN